MKCAHFHFHSYLLNDLNIYLMMLIVSLKCFIINDDRCD